MGIGTIVYYSVESTDEVRSIFIHIKHECATSYDALGMFQSLSDSFVGVDV